MVDVNINIANEDIPTVRRWLAQEKARLVDLMVAGQPTSKTSEATLVYSLVTRFDAQLVEHVEHVRRLEEAERAERRRAK